MSRPLDDLVVLDLSRLFCTSLCAAFLADFGAVRGFSSLMHCDKPTVVKIHGYCVAGGTDIALHADGIVELHERAGDDAVERLNGLYLPEHGGVIEAFVEIRTDVVVAQVVYGDIRAAV